MLHDIQYFDNNDLACYNGYSFRRDKKTGYYLSSKPIGKRRVRLHRYIWETESKRQIPRGYDIHHVDGDKNNNHIDNLMLITKHDHMCLHGDEATEETNNKRVKNLIEKARPKASEWHKSEMGREWHRQHAIKVYSNLEPVEYTCVFCGKKYKTKKRYGKSENTFCSNNCKAAFRRASGVDDVEKECKYCGKKFFTNKYAPAKYCPEHRDRKYRV